MKLTVKLLIIPVIIAICTGCPSAEGSTDMDKTGNRDALVNVNIKSEFWSDYQKLIICEVIPSGIRNVLRSDGGMPNVINAAKKNRGEPWASHQGMFYVETDVWKLVEAMCYALTLDPNGDAEMAAGQNYIRGYLDEWIDYIKDLPEKSGQYPGYIFTYYIINSNQSRRRFYEWNDHELYNSGHYYEMAVAHYTATGSKVLVDAAIKNADLFCTLFGWETGQIRVTPGHPEIELALIKLAHCLESIGGEYAKKAASYIALSEFFIEVRPTSPSVGVYGWSPTYNQNHANFTEQREAVGHSVRAGYTYTGAADLAFVKLTDRYNTALNSIWEDIAYRKSYITGGIGSDRSIEGFGQPYQLDNNTAYNETCASCAFIFFSRSMSLIDHKSRYADEIERSLYNILLASANMEGNLFFYENHMLSSGNTSRSTWYGTACCPPNLMRTMMTLGRYIYRFEDSVLTVEQYIGNEAVIHTGKGDAVIAVESNMPWAGNSRITVKSGASGLVAINLRVPDWAEGNYTLSVNNTAGKFGIGSDGYISIRRKWAAGDSIDINFVMEARRAYSAPQILTNAGLVAVRRGPFIYAAERNDNGYPLGIYVLPKSSGGFSAKWMHNLDGGSSNYFFKDVLCIEADALVNGVESKLTMIPYYAWNNRGQQAMTVYLTETEKTHPIEYFATPSASYTSSYGDSPGHLNNGLITGSTRWTAWRGDPHPVEEEWVQYTFDAPVKITGCDIYWFDDNGGTRIPGGLKIFYRDSSDNVQYVTPVSGSGYSTFDSENVYNQFTPNNEIQSSFNRYRFQQINTKVIRLEIIAGPPGSNENNRRSPGIKQWKITGEWE